MCSKLKELDDKAKEFAVVHRAMVKEGLATIKSELEKLIKPAKEEKKEEKKEGGK